MTTLPSRSSRQAMPYAQRLANLLAEVRAAGYAVHFDAEGVVFSGTDGHTRVHCDPTGNAAIISCLWGEA